MTTPDPTTHNITTTHENIILCGFMGTGKTTVGKIIADRLGWQFMDTDHIIEQEAGHSISNIFAEQGESAFRQMESDVCESLALIKHKVIATGGGIVLRQENRDALIYAGLVVCLSAPVDVIFARLAGATNRPLLTGADPKQRIAELLATRAPAYAALPYHVDTAGRTAQDAAVEIIALWKQTRR